MRNALNASTCTVARSLKRSRGADDDEVGVDSSEVDAGVDAGEGAWEGAGVEVAFEDALDDAGKGAGGAGADAWEEQAMQLCKLLRQPIEEGRQAFLKKSPAFQKWVWDTLDSWGRIA